MSAIRTFVAASFSAAFDVPSAYSRRSSSATFSATIACCRVALFVDSWISLASFAADRAASAVWSSIRLWSYSFWIADASRVTRTSPLRTNVPSGTSVWIMLNPSTWLITSRLLIA